MRSCARSVLQSSRRKNAFPCHAKQHEPRRRHLSLAFPRSGLPRCASTGIPQRFETRQPRRGRIAAGAWIPCHQQTRCRLLQQRAYGFSDGPQNNRQKKYHTQSRRLRRSCKPFQPIGHRVVQPPRILVTSHKQIRHPLHGNCWIRRPHSEHKNSRRVPHDGAPHKGGERKQFLHHLGRIMWLIMMAAMAIRAKASAIIWVGSGFMLRANERCCALHPSSASL